MKWKVLISAPYVQPVIDRFKSELAREGIEVIVPQVRERLSERELLQYIEDIDGVICGDDRFTEKVLRSAKKLKVISKWGTGIDSIDVEACKRIGIMVGNTSNAFTEPVADTVLSYILCFARKLPWADQEIRDGKWFKLPGISLCELTLGIIGVGNIGKAVAHRAIAFGMKIMGNDLLEMPNEFIAKTGIKMVAQNGLLSQSDFISLNCDLNPSSFHLIGDKEFSIMKPSAVIINTARGSIVDERSLVRALEENRIAGAGLDVFEEEPLPENSPLRKMDNVLLSPHNSNSSPAAWEIVHQNTILNLLEGLKRSER